VPATTGRADGQVEVQVGPPRLPRARPTAADVVAPAVVQRRLRRRRHRLDHGEHDGRSPNDGNSSCGVLVERHCRRSLRRGGIGAGFERPVRLRVDAVGRGALRLMCVLDRVVIDLVGAARQLPGDQRPPVDRGGRGVSAAIDARACVSKEKSGDDHQQSCCCLFAYLLPLTVPSKHRRACWSACK
jgi:hypothetical protein